MMSKGQAHTCFTCWPKRPEQLYYRYGRRAQTRGYGFDITYEEFLTFWRKPCQYCGEPIDSIGLDRVDNTCGYKLGNIVPCCGTCNAMKMAQTEADFLRRGHKIAERHSKP